MGSKHRVLLAPRVGGGDHGKQRADNSGHRAKKPRETTGHEAAGDNGHGKQRSRDTRETTVTGPGSHGRQRARKTTAGKQWVPETTVMGRARETTVIGKESHRKPRAQEITTGKQRARKQRALIFAGYRFQALT